MSDKSTRVLAVCSGGGHWIQMKRLLPAFRGQRVSFVTVNDAYRHELSDVQLECFYLVPDASRWSKARLVLTGAKIAWIVLRHRPDVVVSTGAALGFFGILFGKLLGARTIWVDSIANAEGLSLSGAKVGRFADLWLTQWPHLARPDGPRYVGSVL